MLNSINTTLDAYFELTTSIMYTSQGPYCRTFSFILGPIEAKIEIIVVLLFWSRDLHL